MTQHHWNRTWYRSITKSLCYNTTNKPKHYVINYMKISNYYEWNNLTKINNGLITLREYYNIAQCYKINFIKPFYNNIKIYESEFPLKFTLNLFNMQNKISFSFLRSVKWKTKHTENIIYNNTHRRYKFSEKLLANFQNYNPNGYSLIHQHLHHINQLNILR